MKTTSAIKVWLSIILGTAAAALIIAGCGPRSAASATHSQPGPAGMSPQDRQHMTAPNTSGKAAHP